MGRVEGWEAKCGQPECARPPCRGMKRGTFGARKGDFQGVC